MYPRWKLSVLFSKVNNCRLPEAVNRAHRIECSAIIKGQCSSRRHENMLDGNTKKAAERLQIINVSAGSLE